MTWNRLDYTLGAVYFAGLMALGILASRNKSTSNQFLNATGSLPLWVSIAACIAANCGSLDVIAMMGLGAQYGMLACHFYWIGAIPALLVVAFWLLPAYARGRYPTVLDFIAHYYGQQTRSVVALCMAAMMLLLAGVCLCAVAQTMSAFLGWTFAQGLVVTTTVVIFYTWMGGLRATVYTELLHFAIVLSAIVPLFWLVARDFGGIGRLVGGLPAAHRHAWETLPVFAPGATMDVVGVIFGLGLVLSFGYWSTDFVQMQRALGARRAADVRFVPLSIAAAKLVFAFVVVLPGIVAPLVLGGRLQGHWNATLPTLMLHYFKPGWIAIGVMGLGASLVSTFANNVSGFSSAWVQGVYQVWICPGKSDAHYLWAGRITNVLAVFASIGAAYSARSFQSLMEYIQMILSTFNAPIFALVALAGLFPRRARGGGLSGLLAGLGIAGVHQVLVFMGVMHYGSRMTTNFYAAMVSFVVTAGTTMAAGRAEDKGENEDLESGPRGRIALAYSRITVIWAVVVSIVCVAVNVWLR